MHWEFVFFLIWFFQWQPRNAQRIRKMICFFGVLHMLGIYPTLDTLLCWNKRSIMRMRIFTTFFVGVFFKGFCRGSEYSKKELGNRLVFLFHGFYGFYSKKYVFRMAKRFLFGKRSIKSPTKQGTRGKNIFFAVLQENREKGSKKVQKNVKKRSLRCWK